MRLGVRAKLFLISVVLSVASMTAADAYLTTSLTSHMTETIRADLLIRARLVAREAAAGRLDVGGDRAAWDALADGIAASARERVTLIGRDGVVLGDSHVALADLPGVENHATRPEVASALERGEGTAERLSATVGQSMMYAAAIFRRGGVVAGVARVAEPLVEVDRATADVRKLVWLGSAIALALALMLSSAVSKRMSAAIAGLTDTARRMAEGDLSVRTRVDGDDEVAALGKALDRLAGSLARTMTELRTQRDLQGRILDAMHEGVLVLDRDGHVVLVNPALRAMLLLGAESTGKLLLESVRHADLAELLEAARGAHAMAPTEIDLPGLKPRRLLVHASPLLGDDERLLVVFVDVTELRRLESLRRDFVANASHELRTPIAAVRSATETLQDGALGDAEAAARFVDIIDRNAARLQSLVEDMLDLSKLDSKEFKLKRERVELSSVVPIVLGLFRERAEKKGVRLRAELPGAPVAVEGDARAIEHVLSNLVDNAVKYCPGGSEVVVRAAREADRVRLVVSDTGPGIPAEHLPRLFERFYRVDAGRSRELGGTGLGLSIVKHMVEAMRGTVSVESQVGRGSTFAVSLGAAAT